MKKFLYQVAGRAVLVSTLLLAPTRVMAQSVEPITFATGSLESIITLLANWAAGIAGAIAVAFLIYGGFVYITGGEKGAEKAKPLIINAIIGLFVIALAFVIVNTVVGALGGE
ncbi:MAG: hypothetical protein WC805_02310 [Patescibacteria group bacterium]|jgi:hypothetical protein